MPGTTTTPARPFSFLVVDNQAKLANPAGACRIRPVAQKRSPNDRDAPADRVPRARCDAQNIYVTTLDRPRRQDWILAEPIGGSKKTSLGN